MAGTGEAPAHDPDSSSERGGPRGGGLFASTHWSLVLEAGRGDSERARGALETLCRTYWFPVYAYVRRKRRDLHEAQDLTQEFFARVIEKHYLRTADRKRGRFRSFLLASLEHFLAKEWNRAHRQKRGGGVTIVSLDPDAAESQFQLEARDELPPERLFEREWALAVVEQGKEQLRSEFGNSGRGRLFDELRPFLTSDGASERSAEAAAHLEMTPAALRVAIHRLRRRYGECIREVIARTVSRPEEIEEEVRDLLRALG